MKEIFLDTETTGLSYRDNHKIVEIACIETDDLVPTKNVFHKLINPERDVPEEAVKIHGFTTSTLKDKEPFHTISNQFIDFIKDRKIIIHNASFDLGFLNHELRLIKKEEIKKDKIIDSLEIARSKYPGSSNSLDGLCRRFNIDLSKRLKHNALLDCELLREVYINLLDAKEPKLDFLKNEIENKKYIDQKVEVYCKTIIKPSPEELKRHSLFLKNEIKKNYY
jgi:DNA polymerase-3 subunit epsilon